MVTGTREVITSVRSLLGGGSAFTAGNSLLGIVLPLRMEGDGYPVVIVGAVMSGYYLGLAFGGLYGKRIILRVGHIRAFAVFAAVASTIALVYPMAFFAPAWLSLRLLNGFCIAGLTATIESWLNDRSSNATRGRVLGLYMVMHYLAVASGQLLVNLTAVSGFEPFILAAVLITLSLVPVALTSTGAPVLKGHRSLAIGDLYAASPAGVVGAGVAGLLLGSFYALGAIFARGIGLTVAESSFFMTAVVLGGLCFQWQIGILADRYDRRVVLAALLTFVGLSWLLVVTASAAELRLPALLALALVFGGALSSIYPICVAQTFDHLERRHYVSASGRLLMVYSGGAIVGPLLASGSMAAFGPYSFFAFESSVAVGFAGFVAYRIRLRPPISADEQEPFIAAPDVTPVVGDLDPRADDRER